MKLLKHILALGLLMLLCICTLKTTAHAEQETTAAVTEVTTDATTAASTATAEEDAEVTHTFEGYIIVLIAALFGCLVALGFWNVLGA
mgnify:FL=1